MFIGDETLFPGFQIIDGILSPTVLALFEKALELQVPHNVFAVWMALPYPAPAASDPRTYWRGKIGSFKDSRRTPASSGAELRRDLEAREKSHASKL